MGELALSISASLAIISDPVYFSGFPAEAVLPGALLCVHATRPGSTGG
jgi:hypothetical protein